MVKRTLVVALAALAASGALTSQALARGGGGGGGGTSGGSGSGGGTSGGGGGGGGGTDPVLTAPAIPPGTFDGIGSGPVYIHDSFGHAQRTRYTQNGSIVDVVDKPEVNGIRAEYPNNATETWFGDQPSGSADWRFTTTSTDPFEPYTPLQDSEFGYINGSLSIVGAEPGAPDTRPNALLPFPAPADSASTVSGDVAAFAGKTAIGFSRSNASNGNFESDGQAWLELDATGLFPIGGSTGVARWTFHTDGLNGATLTGTYQPGSFDNRAAVSYDPVNHVAAATIDGVVVASVPFTAQSIRYVGVEGSLNGNVDNFTVRAGTVSDPPPDSVAPPTGS